MGTYFKCLHSNDDSACSSSSNFFANSNEIADYEAKKDVCVYSNVKFVMDSVLQRAEGNISKYEAAKKQAEENAIHIHLCSGQMLSTFSKMAFCKMKLLSIFAFISHK